MPESTHETEHPHPPVRAALLDIQGTLLDASNRAIPGAPEAVADLRARGIGIRYVTNIDSVGVATIRGRLGGGGHPES